MYIHVDGKVLPYIYLCYSARAMMQAQLHNSYGAGMDNILSANVRFDEDAACKLEIKDFSDTYCTPLENDRISMVVESGKCSTCF